ncbi:MAG: hypothetical protein MZU95_14275 [Desulfomicrobium escambiense]|nr:hypothetical protein [Desulfomicrobium escambiense]
MLTPTVVDGDTSVTNYIATLPTTFSMEAPLQYSYLRITAKIRVQSTTDNYSTLLVDPNYAGAKHRHRRELALQAQRLRRLLQVQQSGAPAV